MKDPKTSLKQIEAESKRVTIPNYTKPPVCCFSVLSFLRFFPFSRRKERVSAGPNSILSLADPYAQPGGPAGREAHRYGKFLKGLFEYLSLLGKKDPLQLNDLVLFCGLGVILIS